MERFITEKHLMYFREHLYEEEKSSATIRKYMCDLNKLVKFIGIQELTKKKMIEFKEMLKQSDRYKLSSINSFLAAANSFMDFQGWHDLKVKTIRIQKTAFTPENRDLTKEEYQRLVQEAKKKGKNRLALILETICATGIRVSELADITVSGVRQGMAEIYCKGKARRVLIPKILQQKLIYYIGKKSLKHGAVFQTSGGKSVDRSNIWKEMKALCKDANVNESKVFPHNLRHLFAKSFYQIEKDIAKLADMMGHSSIETTRIYVKTTSHEHRRQLDAMRLVSELPGDTT